MATALVSVLTERPVRSEVAMTGEVTCEAGCFPSAGLKRNLWAPCEPG
jgi:ATP-dependent Lon protease